MTPGEKVLVIERSVFDKLGPFNGLMFDVDRYKKEIFAPGVTRFMLRSEAEKNPDFKQLIPYVLMSFEGKLLNYVRGKRAGETRLVGNRSVGIGGHINPVDNTLFSADAYSTYLEAVEREVAEEVIVETPHTNQIVAFLNDDTNEVGKVHLGIVHHWVLEAPKVSRREQMITQMTFMSPAELQAVRESLETWSSLCVDGFDKIQKCK
jgi:predicted NUDIX family phosphoesterase